MKRTYMGVEPSVADNVFVDQTALIIGNVSIASQASIWPYVVIRGDVNRIKVGERTNIQDHTVIHATHDGPYSPGGFATTVGNDVTVGHRAIIHACDIHDRVLVGMGAIIMDGAIIESDVLVAAGSIVTPGKRLHSGGLYRGSPAKRVRDLTPMEHEQLLYSAKHYIRLSSSHSQTK